MNSCPIGNFAPPAGVGPRAVKRWDVVADLLGERATHATRVHDVAPLHRTVAARGAR